MSECKRCPPPFCLCSNRDIESTASAIVEFLQRNRCVLPDEFTPLDTPQAVRDYMERNRKIKTARGP